MWRISTGRSSYHLSYGGQMLLQIGEHLAGLLLRGKAREFDSSPADFAFETKVIPPPLYTPSKFGDFSIGYRDTRSQPRMLLRIIRSSRSNSMIS